MMTRMVALLLACFFLAPIQAISIQIHGADGAKHVRGSGQPSYDTDTETCGDLMNKGAYFAVNVGIGTPMEGTPKQEFELVADTGSDSVIVTSCVCIKSGFCGADDVCYTGTNHSSSFLLKELPINKSIANSTKSPLGVAMTFGSGTVMSIIATDVVQFAGKSATMDDGVLLMVDRRMLKIQGSFQGILGLGPPGMKGHAPSGGEADPNSKAVAATGDKKDKDGAKYDAKLFMQKAGVQRYSLCFNDEGKNGALRLNVPVFKQSLPTIGSFHWGLGLHGISVGEPGDDKNDAFACGKDVDGQKTPCGAIPDSGTTLLMGPKDHVVSMFAALCDKWDRCKEATTTGDMKKEKKEDAFQKLLYNCGDWRTDDKGIGEVPSVFFNVGENGNQQQLELSAWAYIVETTEEQYKHSTRYLFGVVPVDVPQPTGKEKAVCYPSFGVQVYNTKDNGPVWIMGHPLFYQYNVQYNLGGSKSRHSGKGKMEMAFTKEKCSPCTADKASFLASSGDVEPAFSGDVAPKQRARATRVLHDSVVPLRDYSLPL